MAGDILIRKVIKAGRTFGILLPKKYIRKFNITENTYFKMLLRETGQIELRRIDGNHPNQTE